MGLFFIRLWRWLCGWVQFDAEGGAAGRFLSLAAREGISLWDTRREGIVLSARCRAADYRRLRAPAKRSGLRLHVRERHGAVFTLRHYHARPGLVVGIAVYALLLLWLSGRIWAVDIRGLSSADESALRALLAEQGIAVGQKKANVQPEDVQLAAIRQLGDISWLAVNLDGCIAEVEVRESTADQTPPPDDTPSNLVATRDGVILSLEITGGEATVQVGDAVAEGGLLASGITATERETLFRRSAGVVTAATEREIVVTVPLTETQALPCGTPHETMELYLFGWQLPLSDSDAVRDGCRLEECDRRLTLGNVTLPLGVRLCRLTPLAEQTVYRTVEEAEAIAHERLREEEALTLTGVRVAGRVIDTAADENAVTLRAVYRCVENIAREIPLQLDPPSAADENAPLPGK